MATPDYRLTKKDRGVFAYTAWDAVPVLAGLAHLAFDIWLIADFAKRSWEENLVLGMVYAWSISWNINSVSHNFLHTPYFRARWLNRAFSFIESLAIGFSQTFYTWVHLRHHRGNSDRPGPDGKTVDWLSIYRYGNNGQPESVFGYVFKGFFRDDPGDIYKALKEHRPRDAMYGRLEILAFAAFVLVGLIYDWRAVLFLVPFYYLGECLSQLNGYYEHFNGNPDEPLAWGVSTYAPVYNLLWLNNGHHAEHHYRPTVHWTQLPAFHRNLEAKQRAKGTHVIETAHAFGFLANANRKSHLAIEDA